MSAAMIRKAPRAIGRLFPHLLQYPGIALVLFLFFLVVSSRADRSAPKILSRTVYRSPDHRLVATVFLLKQLHHYGDPPSRVEIRTAGGRLLASRDHSKFPDQGYTIRKAGWTADSRFFVYSVKNSGGHSPWHQPIFFYSRKHHRLYCLDRALASLGQGPGSITGDMTLQSPCTLLTKGRYYGKSRKGLQTRIEAGDQSGEQILAIDLRWLEPRLNRSAEGFVY